MSALAAVVISLHVALAAPRSKETELELSREQSEALLAQNQAMNEAGMRGRFDVLVDATHPSVIEGIGGKKRAVLEIERGMASMKAAGFTILETHATEVRACVKVGIQYQCVVDGYQRLRVPQGTARAETETLAISDDGGKRWFFIANSQSPEALRAALPWVSRRLPLRGQGRPVMERP